MRYSSPSSDPFYFHQYDETYEHHESSRDTSSTPESSVSFHEWYTQKSDTLKQSGDNFSLHILKESYYKILHYSIQSLDYGSIIPETQKICYCLHLLNQYKSLYIR